MKPHVDHKKREDYQQICRARIQDGHPLVIPRLTEMLFYIVLAVLGGPAILIGEEPVSFDALGAKYEIDVRPLLSRFCLECHSTKQKEGELDLERFDEFDDVRLDPVAWQKVDETLGSGEMPPKDTDQLSARQQKRLHGWVRRYLSMEARAVCGGEFGRTPAVEIPLGSNALPTGRDHDHHGFTVWLAGGGVKGGMAYGATDEFGYQAVENRVHVHDLHATMLHLMGFDHERLTYRHAGRDFRLTDVHGTVVDEIIA